jgi:hypothetical protein
MVQATVVLAAGASVGMTLAPNAAEALPLMPETSERATTFTPFKPFGIRAARATAGGGHVLGVTTGAIYVLNSSGTAPVFVALIN